MPIFKKFSDWFYPLLIILICGFLAWKNYVPGTILSGWDTLHPEFNFWLYLKRSLNGVWMEHQGLGAVASQSHPAELTRLLIVGAMGHFLPDNLLRYSFMLACLGVGALGIYFFSRYLLSQKVHKFINSSSFLASLFYLLNLTTVQQFHVPLEMFAVHYATLPWLFYLASKYIQGNRKDTLVWFGIITLLSTSMAHTATLFYVYLLSLGLFTVLLNFKKSSVLILTTLLINSFWLLPNLYFLKTHSKDVSASKIHTVFTGEAALQSEAFGTFNDLALSKNFLFNWQDFDFNKNEFFDMMHVWKEHLGKTYVAEIGYLLFGLSIFGLLVSVFRKSKYSASLIPIFLVTMFFWINSNYPFEGIFDYLRSNVDLFREGLRFPFTKFSIMMIMALSVWFAYSSQLMITIFSKIKIGFVYFFIVLASLFYFQLPQFQGNLINKSMLVKIPDEYFDMFKWFDAQDSSGRVARLPLNTYWGWQYNSWKYEGAGFSWFGIKQPILEREFDRWSPHNETFYLQASKALHDNNSEEFNKVLKKYQVKYLFLDESIINAGGDNSALKIGEIKDVLNTLEYKLVFKSSFLSVYDTGFTSSNFIDAINNYKVVDTNLIYSQVDPIYSQFGNYVNSPEGIGYPFVNYDARGDVVMEIRNEKQVTNSVVEIRNDKTKSKVEIPIAEKTVETFEAGHGFEEAFNCDLKELGTVKRTQEAVGRRYRAEGGAAACDYFVFSDLKYDQAYVVKIKGENIEGRSLKIYLYNWVSQRVELEELLPEGEFENYFVVYPKPNLRNNADKLDGGFTLNVETRSFGNVASENVVEAIEFVPFDIDLVSNLYIDTNSTINSEPITVNRDLQILNTQKWGTSLYRVETSGSGILQLGQGYDEGWISFSVNREPWTVNRLEHLQVNTWSNGWVIPSEISSQTSVIYILFWPQLLEWVGLSLLPPLFIFLVKRR